MPSPETEMTEAALPPARQPGAAAGAADAAAATQVLEALRQKAPPVDGTVIASGLQSVSLKQQLDGMRQAAVALQVSHDGSKIACTSQRPAN